MNRKRWEDEWDIEFQRRQEEERRLAEEAFDPDFDLGDDDDTDDDYLGPGLDLDDDDELEELLDDE